jgi:hypothetical protein
MYNRGETCFKLLTFNTRRLLMLLLIFLSENKYVARQLLVLSTPNFRIQNIKFPEPLNCGCGLLYLNKILQII